MENQTVKKIEDKLEAGIVQVCSQRSGFYTRFFFNDYVYFPV